MPFYDTDFKYVYINLDVNYRRLIRIDPFNKKAITVLYTRHKKDNKTKCITQTRQ